MKNRIATTLNADRYTSGTIADEHLSIADYKQKCGGDVVICGGKIADIKCVHLNNPNKILVFFAGFKDNALKISKGVHSQQCECVICPDRCGQDDWVLFVETKYAASPEAAFHENYKYPDVMINQIITTVLYFRDKSILAKDKVVHAIISFPNLVEEFNSAIFSCSKLSIEDILVDYKIIIRGTNKSNIVDEQVLELTS